MIRFAENLNKMITAGLGGALEAPSTEVAVGHRVRYMDASGAVATFETNAAALIRSLRVDMLPIQEGSGDPSPVNIRPITGRTEVTVERTGKNLFPNTIWEENPAASKPVTWEVSGDTIKLGKNSATTGFMTAGFNCNLVENQTYTLSVESIVLNASDVVTTKPTLVVFYDDGTNQNFGANWTFTPTRVVKHFRLSIGITNVSWRYVTIKGLQIELGSTASDYEPFDGQSVTVQLGQTVYGGNAEIISGSSESTYGMVDLGTLNWNGPSYERYYSAAIPDAMPNAYLATYIVCTCYRAGTPAPSLQNGQIAIDNQRRIFIRDSRFTDKSQIAADLSGQYLCYRIATPTSLTLTPASLSTLRGENSVRSDAGDVTLKYPYYEETEGY